MVEVFRTNVKEVTEADQIIKQLQSQSPLCSVNFDLEDCDCILRIEGTNIDMHSIKDMLLRMGYECEALM
jgi:hypothetical protein